MERRQRVANLALPLFLAAKRYCPREPAPYLGVQLHSLKDYPLNQQDAVKEMYNSLEGIGVQTTTRGAPAHNRLLPGDQLLRINQHPVGSTTPKTLRLLNQALSSDTVTIELLRNGEKKTVQIAPIQVCRYRISISGGQALNAYAYGQSISITQGMLRFAEEDNQLALILAHEIAHNLSRHTYKKLKNGLLGGVVDLVVSASTGVVSPGFAAGVAAHFNSQSLEVEADLMGLQLMHEAGYPIKGLEEFWRRLAIEQPSSIWHGQQASHPTTVERYLLMKQAIEKITLEASAAP